VVAVVAAVEEEVVLLVEELCHEFLAGTNQT